MPAVTRSAGNDNRLYFDQCRKHINERTDWANLREELGDTIQNLRGRRVDWNVEKEGSEFEKCMKRVGGEQ